MLLIVWRKDCYHILIIGRTQELGIDGITGIKEKTQRKVSSIARLPLRIHRTWTADRLTVRLSISRNVGVRKTLRANVDNLNLRH